MSVKTVDLMLDMSTYNKISQEYTADIERIPLTMGLISTVRIIPKNPETGRLENLLKKNGSMIYVVNITANMNQKGLNDIRWYVSHRPNYEPFDLKTKRLEDGWLVSVGMYEDGWSDNVSHLFDIIRKYKE